MPGRLAIDFGTSNTVLAVWDEARREGVPLQVPDYGRLEPFGSEQVSVVPSLIHYAADGRCWVGNQVLERELASSPQTFRWMKRYVMHRSPVKVRLPDGREVSHQEAGRDFLATVLAFAAADQSLGDEEVALSVPVEAFEHYEDWLAGVAESAHLPHFRLIDEPSAAALGYGAPIQPGDVYLLFDFGGGTLDIAVVLVESEVDAAVRARSKTDTEAGRCRVLGKAGTDLGGMTIDQWLYEEVVRQSGHDPSDDAVRRVSRALLVECETAKGRLSEGERTPVRVADVDSGVELAAEFTRGQFEELLDRHEAFTRIEQTIGRALNDARERGYSEDSVKNVLMVGGSSLIPSVQRALQRRFGRERVRLNRPLDAVARGAAAFVAGVDFYDHVQHDYAIRSVDFQKGEYDYRRIVRRGTPYPTRQPVARLTLKATHDGQTQLGLAIFELGERRRRSADPPVELVFDPTGAARVMEVTPDEEERRSYFWVNEQSPTFLPADPPAKQGEARFEVEFGIDGNKRLLVTARDLRTGRLTHRDHPVIRLT
jgi:molecular chaperone DnaK (HSP70)